MNLLASALLLLPQAAAAAAAEVPPPPPALWERVVVIGASASAGFGTHLELREPISLAAVLEPLLAQPHQPVQGFASEYFFLNPTRHGANQVQDALEAEPTLVLGLDFLFWYLYGFHPDEEARLASLEHGLGLLESFDCPVLIALIPDMSAAIGTMLAEAQVPEPETFTRANERIRAFVAERQHLLFVPVNELVAEARSGEPVTVGASTWPENAAARLIQADHLHPTLEGMAALAVKALEAVAAAHPQATKGAFRLDPLAAAAAVRKQYGRTASANADEP